MIYIKKLLHKEPQRRHKVSQSYDVAVALSYRGDTEFQRKTELHGDDIELHRAFFEGR
jgi:hypothetical protein